MAPSTATTTSNIASSMRRAAAVDAARKGEPIPSGTVLTLVQYKAQVDAQGNPIKDANGRFIKGDLVGFTVMEKRTGWGTEYPDDLRNGEWEYQAFLADRKVNDKANLTGCFQCHKPHAAQDFVISLASLKGTAPGELAAPQPGPGIVSIANFLFGPEQVSVAAGAPITWHNTDGSPHQVTIRGGKPQRTAVLLKGQSASLTIAEPGTYEYICGLHPEHEGQDRGEVTATCPSIRQWPLARGRRRGKLGIRQHQNALGARLLACSAPAPEHALARDRAS